jgi:hypothetical protein
MDDITNSQPGTSGDSKEQKVTGETMDDHDNRDGNLTDFQRILLRTLPAKSAEEYRKAWNLFRQFLGINDDQIVPNEQNYITYFDYLRRCRKFKGSTLWSIYARLNGCHQRLYGKLFLTLFWPRFWLRCPILAV